MRRSRKGQSAGYLITPCGSSGQLESKPLRTGSFHHSNNCERGQFYLDGKLIPFPTLLKAFATPPDDDSLGKTMQRWLKVTLPAGAKPTDAVFHYRLRQIAAAADRIGLRHQLFPE